MTKSRPTRIQRMRAKGSRSAGHNTVYVGRPTKWANPFDMKTWINAGFSRKEAREFTAEQFEQCLLRGDRPVDPNKAKAMERIKADISELRGKTLACWCPIDEPCHAIALLRLANT